MPTSADQAPTQAETPWMILAECATYARRHQNTIWKALVSGELRGNQTGRHGTWLVHRDDLDAWIRGDVADVQVPATTRRRA